MSHRLPSDDETTQCKHPVRAVSRTAVASTAAAVPIIWPILDREIGRTWATVAVVAMVAGNALVTRVLAIPAVEAWLRVAFPALSATGNRRDRLDLSAPAPAPRALVMASQSDDVVTLDHGGGVHAADNERVVSGLVIPWNQEGKTTAGPLTIPRGAVRLPRELARCKLLFKHTGTDGHRPIGHALGFEAKDDGLHMSFTVARTPDGDAAIQQVREGVYDAFSAELRSVKQSASHVMDSIMTGVALVDRPAFDEARVHSLHAQLSDPPATTGELTMNAAAFIAAMIAAGATPDAARTAALEHFDPADVDAAIADTAPAPAVTEPTDRPAPLESAHASYTAPRPQIVPAGLTPTGSALTVHASAYDAAATILSAATGKDVVHAALTDITNSGLIDATPPQWLGELWSGPAKTRRIVPLMASRDLRSWRIEGFTWTQKPMVAAYAGDKVEIPTGPVAVAPYSAEATRWAGGHDLDRKFWDFGDAGILESYWRFMNESYALVTDQAAGAFVVANATTVTDAAATDLLRAMIVASAAVDDAVGIAPSYYLANPADKFGLLDVTNQSMPAFFDMFGVDPRSIVWTSQVPAGSLVAGAKPAATFHELPGSPLRVEAEHLSHGGRDRAMFGYSALTLDNPAALVSVDFAGTGGV